MKTMKKLVLAVILLCGICSGTCAENRADTDIPVPASASPELRALIAAKPPQWWNSHPETAAEWKKLRDTRQKKSFAPCPHYATLARCQHVRQDDGESEGFHPDTGQYPCCQP